MKEIVLVCTFQRNELLHTCLKRIREADHHIPVKIFPDRGTWKDERLKKMAFDFAAEIIHVPEHSYPGNSYNAGEALRYAYHTGYDLAHYIEDDAFCKPDLFSWTRQVHEENDDIFCSAGWVFNLHSPIDSGDYFAQWLYIPQFSMMRDKLQLVVDHLGPCYYENMQGFLAKRFSDVLLNLYPNMVHYEIDGLLQRILIQNKMQVAWPSVAKVEHMGFGGYNRGGYEHYEKTLESIPPEYFESRIRLVEDLASDQYWRAQTFGRAIVEREVGHELPKREFHYQIRMPGGWEAELKTEISRAFLPKRILSVPMSQDAEIVLKS